MKDKIKLTFVSALKVRDYLKFKRQIGIGWKNVQ